MPDKTSSGYDLSSSPSHLLHRAQQFAADRFASAFDGEPITQRQFAVLVAVASKDNLTQTDLVKLTGIDRSTLAELVARMTKKGFLKRTRAKNDARANIVTLTAKGRTLLGKAEPVVKKADATILDIIPASKRSAFLSILKSIAESLDMAPEPAAPAKAAPKAAAKSKATKKAAPKRKAAPKARATAKTAKAATSSRATKAKKPARPTKPRTKK